MLSVENWDWLLKPSKLFPFIFILKHLCMWSLTFCRALVEVKPVLYVPENREDEDNLILPPTVCTEIPNYWGFEYSNIRDRCCQIYTIRGKTCTALISITKEIAASICFEADQSIESFQCYGSEIHMKSIAKLCIYLLDGILLEKNFPWREIIVSSLLFWYS